MGTGEKKSVDTGSLSHSYFPSALGMDPLLSRPSPLLLPLFASFFNYKTRKIPNLQDYTENKKEKCDAKHPGQSLAYAHTIKDGYYNYYFHFKLCVSRNHTLFNQLSL